MPYPFSALTVTHYSDRNENIKVDVSIGTKSWRTSGTWLILRSCWAKLGWKPMPCVHWYGCAACTGTYTDVFIIRLLRFSYWRSISTWNPRQTSGLNTSSHYHLPPPPLPRIGHYFSLFSIYPDDRQYLLKSLTLKFMSEKMSLQIIHDKLRKINTSEPPR